MKKLLAGLCLLSSISTMASTVDCEISARQENGNWKPIDSVTLGQTEGSYVSEIGRPVKKLNDLYMNVILGSDDSLQFTLLSGSNKFLGKPLYEAQGNASGLRFTSAMDGISVLCIEK